MFKLRRSDMEKRPAQFIMEAINIVSERSESSPKLSDFAKDIKQILDSRFGGEWNILVGKSMGYAMKTKKKASLVAGSSSGQSVVCWKSPGFEVEDSSVVRIRANIELAPTDPLFPGETSTSRLSIIESPATNSEQIIKILEACLDGIRELDNQEAARYIRSQITARLGTVWHVTVGETQGFHMEPARGAEDHTIVALKKGGMKIELYRHKQVTPAGLSSLQPTIPSLSTMLDILPKILFLFLCISFLVQRSSYCHVVDLGIASNARQTFCSIMYSIPLAPLAGMLFVSTVFKEFRKMRNRRTQQKQKAQ